MAPPGQRHAHAAPVRSCVRLRPLSSHERATSAFSVSGTKLSLRREVLEEEGRADWLADSEYNFDAVFGPETSTATVYARAAAEIVPWCVKGVNCTIIAYGQTAAGKTHTMLGAQAVHSPRAALPASGHTSERGMIALAVDDVLRRVGAAGQRRHRLRVSFLEIYNEQCNDLLAADRGANLKLFERADGVVVPGVSEWDVSDSDKLEALLRQAERQRHVGTTYSNDRSSRSHLLCTVSVDSWAGNGSSDAASATGAPGAPAPSGADPNVLSATLQLVDLAGSERRQAASEGQSHEGACIPPHLP